MLLEMALGEVENPREDGGDTDACTSAGSPGVGVEAAVEGGSRRGRRHGRRSVRDTVGRWLRCVVWCLL